MCGGRSVWPAVPRIIQGESFGSWFGRIAARYRVDVDELGRIAEIKLDLGTDACQWLAAPAPQGRHVARLSALTGIPAEQIAAMGYPADPTTNSRYCFKCLVLNPDDVFSPFWQRQWLEFSWTTCDRHPNEVDALSPTALRTNKNMYKLLRFVSRRHARRVGRMRC